MKSHHFTIIPSSHPRHSFILGLDGILQGLRDLPRLLPGRRDVARRLLGARELGGRRVGALEVLTQRGDLGWRWWGWWGWGSMMGWEKRSKWGKWGKWWEKGSKFGENWLFFFFCERILGMAVDITTKASWKLFFIQQGSTTHGMIRMNSSQMVAAAGSQFCFFEQYPSN